MEQETSRHYKKEKCPDCSSTNILHDYDTGEAVCGDCGLVLHEQMMDKGSGQRYFTEEQKVKRVHYGPPSLQAIHDKGLSTMVGYEEHDAHGKKLPPSTRLQMWRLRKWQIRTRVRDSVDKNLVKAMSELDRLSEKIYVPPPVKEEAAVIYRKALDEGIIRGRSIEAIATAAFYAACRENGIPRTVKEIAEASLVDKKEVNRCYRMLLRELDVQMPVPNLISYVSKIASPIGISEKTQGRAIEIIRMAKKIPGKYGAGGKDPMGLAAAALYIACLENNEPGTQREIAERAGVTEVTVRNRYRPLMRRLDITIPKKH